MNAPTLDQIDQPAILQVIFHPRPDTSPPNPKLDVQIPVDSAVTLGARLHAAGGPTAPLILFFHGNGEIAADYDDIAPTYNRLGINFLAVDYRGYGRSTGKPTVRTLLADARTVWDTLPSLCTANNVKPAKIYVMGRSLGSASALEIATHAGNAVSGLIIESGFAYGMRLIARLGGLESAMADDGRIGLGHLAKIGKISVPTLILHGEEDWIIPVEDAHALYTHAGAQDKRLVTIPAAGHNDLLFTGTQEYFTAIRDLIGAPPESGSDDE